MYAIVCPLVFLAGLIDSIAGGGGLISLPAYYVAGLDPALAAGTNKLSAGLGTMTSSARFIRDGKVNWRIGLIAALGALPSSWLGAWVFKMIPENVVRIMMIAAIPLVACVVLRRRDSLNARSLVPQEWTWAAALAVGAVIGFYDGLVGPGTGTFLILCFTMFLGMEGVMASGTAKIVNLSSNIAALLNLAGSGDVLVALGLPAAACGMAGNWLGASLTIKRGTGFIRGVLLVVLALLLLTMIYEVVASLNAPAEMVAPAA